MHLESRVRRIERVVQRAQGLGRGRRRSAAEVDSVIDWLDTLDDDHRRRWLERQADELLEHLVCRRWGIEPRRLTEAEFGRLERERTGGIPAAGK